jgi:pantothenate kinase
MSVKPHRKILAIDVGGTHVKLMHSPHSGRDCGRSGGCLTKRRSFRSNPKQKEN